MDIIKELDDLLNKYNITIYDVMKIYERNQVKAIRQVQCYEENDKVWQYYNEFNNPCGCGSNCYHFEYDRVDDEIYGVCNCCNKNIYIVDKQFKSGKLKQGKWVDKDWKFVREKL